MTTHDKPAAMTIETDKWKVRLTPVNQQCPSGLASVGWTRTGWDLNAKIVNKESGEIITERNVGSLMWRPNGNCAWSLGSVEGLWSHGNTLYKVGVQGEAWSYKTDAGAFAGMCRFVKHNLENGVTPLTKAVA